jgi:formylglycine-generating enzyme required for sulfatase activity
LRVRSSLLRIRALSALALSALAVVSSLSCKDSSLPPLPESIVVVDTNLPVPGVASRLRIDLYAEDGHWFDSRDVALPDPRDWPTSFGVFSDDESRERTVWVRLRAYPDGRVRDYRGERTLEWEKPFAVLTGDDQPRLVRDGADLTPSFEPEPLVTVDRLVRVQLRPEISAATDVLLHGACIGTMPGLGNIAAGQAESCVDEEKLRAPVTELPTREGGTSAGPGGPTKAGTWLSSPCGAATSEDRVCVPGGGTLVGASDQLREPPGSPSKPSLPVRAFGVSSFWMDKTEVTVGTIRAALAAGLKGGAPLSNNGPLAVPGGLDDIKGCTYSDTPMGREDFGVTCWKSDQARAYCQREGGDLPTEAQWEHAATMAGRPRKTRYPWGNEDASCARAATSRAIFGGKSPCENEALGPDAVTAHPDDVTPSGVLGLAGGVGEWMRDGYADYTSKCWAATTIANPECADRSLGFSFRGGAWVTPLAWSTYRIGFPIDNGTLMPVGFRCVYEVQP